MSWVITPLLHDPKILNTKCMGEFATSGQFRPFRQAKISLNWRHHCTRRELLYTYQIKKVTKQT